MPSHFVVKNNTNFRAAKISSKIKLAKGKLIHRVLTDGLAAKNKRLLHFKYLSLKTVLNFSLQHPLTICCFSIMFLFVR